MTEAIATVNNNGNSISTGIDFNIPRGFINTVDMTTAEGRNTVVKAINDAVSLNDFVGMEIKVKDIITMPGVRKGRNGASDMPCQNTILIDTDGVAYFTQSDGIARGIQTYGAIFWDANGNLTASEGYLSLMVKERELPNGNRLKTIVPFEPAKTKK